MFFLLYIVSLCPEEEGKSRAFVIRKLWHVKPLDGFNCEVTYVTHFGLKGNVSFFLCIKSKVFLYFFFLGGGSTIIINEGNTYLCEMV